MCAPRRPPTTTAHCADGRKQGDAGIAISDALNVSPVTLSQEEAMALRLYALPFGGVKAADEEAGADVTSAGTTEGTNGLAITYTLHYTNIVT